MYKRYVFVKGLWHGSCVVEWRGNTLGLGLNLRFFHYYSTACQLEGSITLGPLHIVGDIAHRG